MKTLTYDHRTNRTKLTNNKYLTRQYKRSVCPYTYIYRLYVYSLTVCAEMCCVLCLTIVPVNHHHHLVACLAPRARALMMATSLTTPVACGRPSGHPRPSSPASVRPQQGYDTHQGQFIGISSIEINYRSSPVHIHAPNEPSNACWCIIEIKMEPSYQAYCVFH